MPILPAMPSLPVSSDGSADRPLESERDWWRVRALLVETWPLVGPGWNWDVRRWDGWRFHNEQPVSVAQMSGIVRLWESASGRLLGVAHREGPGEVFLEIRPESRAIEAPMLSWAEATLATTGPDGRQWVELAVFDDDDRRQRLLGERGFRRLDSGGCVRTMSLDALAARPNPRPAGYVVREAGNDPADCARMADLLNQTFGRTIHSGPEYATFVTHAPSFDEDLNLVAVAADGAFAAHVGVCPDVVNRHAIVEPVATHPDHRRRGLAAVLLDEGLRRAAAKGATIASVETGDAAAANAFYEAVGFVQPRRFHQWRRDWGG